MRKRAAFLRQDSAFPDDKRSQVQEEGLTEKWGMEQIDDFGLKLGLLDARKREGNENVEESGGGEDDRVQRFQHLSEVILLF